MGSAYWYKRSENSKMNRYDTISENYKYTINYSLGWFMVFIPVDQASFVYMVAKLNALISSSVAAFLDAR